ncbi:glycoside hydrolase family 13 protein [Nakamurella multipartita]|uniref:Alpha amylase catalytic region n=1 Tax=Nakamurella multipartita (strain ATCC 700099 / DSM 44233 / CIP 104796 / JCM 9543 / NBRC 105858 / Y-104) TaxID=479431 RepID=C8XAR5_NAKMY|nr:alpha-amylase family glycosyl hydrolase [Nakamurella multipartita]ACV79318.1 alpha amylase catalytic region [Nakamurella multipartita DSM 44233]
MSANSQPVPVTAAEPSWWRSAVIYQIYPRSFADGNGDGIGDLAGIRSRLPYLVDLGVDAIWISPFYPSPQADAGYDVADYRDIDPVFGTLPEFSDLVAECHRANVRVIVDLVPNHTSDQHAWFQAALAAGPGSPERARYLFREGRGANGELPPNNWVSNFGGPAWTRVPDGQWYLHLFAPQQPDLDWTNPEVVAEFHDILRFWMKLGVDGFRIDVAHGLAKDADLADLPGGAEGHLLTPANTNDHPHWDRDEIHEVYRGWRAVVDEFGGDRVFCAEAYVPNPQRFADYVRPDELHTAFNFDFLQATWDAADYRRVIDETMANLRAVGAPATWVLSNHDVVRHPTRFGGGQLGLDRARAGTLLMFALPGGAYVYQGEELGLPEVLDIPAQWRQDPIFFRSGGERLGRDGCRVPLPWSDTQAPYGFGPAGTPWLPQRPVFGELSVQAQTGDPASTLEFYRRALRIRRERPELGDGPMQWLDAPDGMLVLARGQFRCAINFTDEPLPLPPSCAGATLLLSSSATADQGLAELGGNTAAWFLAG